MADVAILGVDLVKDEGKGGYLVVSIECYGLKSVPARGAANTSRHGREGSAGATVVRTCFRENEAEYLVRARIHSKRVSGCGICLSQNQTKARP